MMETLQSHTDLAALHAEYAAAQSYAEPLAKRCKGMGRPRSSGDPNEEGEVRFRDADSAARAVQLLGHSVLGGHQLNVALDPQSQDGTKIVVTNMPPGIAWQELKDHFIQVGEVQYASIGRTIHDATGARGFGYAQPGFPCVGEVRFSTSEEAQQALHSFNGQLFKGAALTLKPDLSSWHGTKLLVFNVPVGTDWTELKEHFEPAGQIQFCGIDCAVKGKGKNHAKGFQQPQDTAWPPYAGAAPASWSGCGAQSAGQWGQVNQATGLPEAPDGGGDAPMVGEVRFESAQIAEQAIALLNGSHLGPQAITVVQDGGCRDGSRVLVFGVPAGTSRHLLKEHFEQVGVVAFCGWKGKGAKGLGKDHGGKGQQPFDAGPQPGPAYQCAGGMAEATMQQPSLVGEVRYLGPAEAAEAISLFNGSQFGDAVITVIQDGGCKDGSRVLVFNLPQDTPRQALQEYFEQAGAVAFCGWKGKGKGSSKLQQGFDPTAGAYMAAGMAGADAQWGYAAGQEWDAQLSMQYQGAADMTGVSGTVPLIGEVRFENRSQAEQAISHLNGSVVGSVNIQVVLDGGCRDGSRVFVLGLQPGTPWQILKEHFSRVGVVCYAGYKTQGRQQGHYAAMPPAMHNMSLPQECGAVSLAVPMYGEVGAASSGVLPVTMQPGVHYGMTDKLGVATTSAMDSQAYAAALRETLMGVAAAVPA